MRPETTITLNKSSFRADEPITGFVDIDINQTVPGEWDPKRWVVKVRLVGYAQMDTQWQEHALNPNSQERARYETVPIEECEVIVRSTDVPVYVKPGVSNRVRSLPFRIQLSPAQLIASYNAQKGLFLVDYLLTATARRKCPRTGWNLLKLETRTFVSITPPQVEIEKPLHVTPYSPPLDDMDLFRCPFMQTIRFNYSSRLTPSTMSPSHRMSLYFPLPLYEPEEISLSLTSTLTLRYNQVVNRHTDTTLLPYETYYRPDTGGEEVLVEFDIPIKTPQTMDFKFTKGTMTMSHSLRVTMHATLFPADKNKSARKIWSVDLPVTIRGRHYVEEPLSPPLSAVLSSESASPELARSSLSLKGSENSQGSWIQDRFDMSDESDDEESMPRSAVSASTSFATSTGYSERTSTESDSSQRSMNSPTSKRQPRVNNMVDMPPQKPVPTGPLPRPPESSTPSPVRHRLSPEQQHIRPKTGERPRKKHAAETNSEGRRSRSKAPRPDSRTRSRSVPASKEEQRPATYDYFSIPVGTRERITSPTPEPLSANSMSTKSTMPPTPPAPSDVPSYYHAKPSYYLDNSIPRTASRARAYTTGSSAQSPLSPEQSPVSTSPQATRVKFTDPEVMESPGSPPPVTRIPPASSQTKLPFPRSPPEAGFPFRSISPPPRMNNTTPTGQSFSQLTLAEMQELASSVSLSSPQEGIPSQPRSPISPISPRQQAPPLPRLATSSSQFSSSSLPRLTTPVSPNQGPPSPSHISPTSRSPSTIPTKIPIKPPAPAASHLPTARPPLPSQSRIRIVSMSTDTTTSTSRAATASTAATSRSAQSSGNTIRVQVKRRPTAPSLFPPLPPATLAGQQTRLAQRTQGDGASPTLKGVQIRKVDRPGPNWI